ncbi:hypothetical protein V5O48_013405 [Marasmius crinis-equi]|uniref:Cytochrome P450 n=1 Tax=Marasmius crinis-equi TaxID=585013 RepID=A0ABR3F062_9AGAR
MGYIHLFIASVFCISIWTQHAVRQRRQKYALPPGPPGDPLIGHLRIIPTERQADIFHEWSKVYGDVMYLEVLGRKMVILSSIEAAQGILETKGANYSCRPKFTLFELMGWYPTITFLQYGKRFLKMRKMVQTYFGKKETLAFNFALAEEARLLVKNLHDSARGKHLHYVQRFTISSVMRAAFGHQVKSDDDVFLGIGKRVSQALNNCGPAGNTPVDFFPWLQYCPSWFPGMHYVNLARNQWYKVIRELHDHTLAYVQEGMKTKTVQRSFTSDHLESLGDRDDIDPEEVEDIKGAASTLFAAGEDSTYVTLTAFMIAMVQNPDVQRRAYEEIVSVVGHDKLPDVNDRERLPYLDCILQETLRWAPCSRTFIFTLLTCILGLVEAGTTPSPWDEVYNGMFIPKNTIVIPNILAMNRDERVYPNPKTFNPSRFLGGKSPLPSVWGFGRRICPGRYFADLAIWNVIACVLAALELVPPRDETGNEVMPEMVVTEGLSSGIAPFDFEVRPRSERVTALITVLE